jgi:hypothetical protein
MCVIKKPQMGSQDNIYVGLCVVVTVAMVIPLRNFGSYEVIFMTVCLLLAVLAQAV